MNLTSNQSKIYYFNLMGTNLNLSRVQQLLDRIIAANPRRYFLLKNAYNNGLMHELLAPNHWAIGVAICKNSSSELVISGFPVCEQLEVNNKQKNQYIDISGHLYRIYQILSVQKLNTMATKTAQRGSPQRLTF